MNIHVHVAWHPSKIRDVSGSLKIIWKLILYPINKFNNADYLVVKSERDQKKSALFRCCNYPHNSRIGIRFGICECNSKIMRIISKVRSKFTFFPHSHSSFRGFFLWALVKKVRIIIIFGCSEFVNAIRIILMRIIGECFCERGISDHRMQASILVMKVQYSSCTYMDRCKNKETFIQKKKKRKTYSL